MMFFSLKTLIKKKRELTDDYNCNILCSHYVQVLCEKPFLGIIKINKEDNYNC